MQSEGDNPRELVQKPTSTASKQICGAGADAVFTVKAATNGVLESPSVPSEESGGTTQVSWRKNPQAPPVRVVAVLAPTQHFEVKGTKNSVLEPSSLPGEE